MRDKTFCKTNTDVGRALRMEDELNRLFEEWERIHLYGNQDLNFPDGYSLNILRGQIEHWKNRIARQLYAKDFPSIYYRDTPEIVENEYMARRIEILELAKRSLTVYEDSQDYLRLVQAFGRLSEKVRMQTGIYYAVEDVEKLKKAIEENDYVTMRVHESPFVYLEKMRECSDRIERIESRMNCKRISNECNPNMQGCHESIEQIPGQMNIFSFIAS